MPRPRKRTVHLIPAEKSTSLVVVADSKPAIPGFSSQPLLKRILMLCLLHQLESTKHVCLRLLPFAAMLIERLDGVEKTAQILNVLIECINEWDGEGNN